MSQIERQMGATFAIGFEFSINPWFWKFLTGDAYRVRTYVMSVMAAETLKRYWGSNPAALGLNPGGAGVTVPLAIVPFILQKKKDTTAISRQAKNLYHLCHDTFIKQISEENKHDYNCSKKMTYSLNDPGYWQVDVPVATKHENQYTR